MELEWQKLIKLNNLETNLAALLQKIDNEIIQTDVEWMHLKNIAQAQKCPPKAESESENENNSSKPTPECLMRPEHNVDDQTINNMELDLTLQESTLEDLELESD